MCLSLAKSSVLLHLETSTSALKLSSNVTSLIPGQSSVLLPPLCSWSRQASARGWIPSEPAWLLPPWPHDHPKAGTRPWIFFGSQHYLGTMPGREWNSIMAAWWLDQSASTFIPWLSIKCHKSTKEWDFSEVMWFKKKRGSEGFHHGEGRNWTQCSLKGWVILGRRQKYTKRGHTGEMEEHQQSHGTEKRWHIGRWVRINAEELKTPLENGWNQTIKDLKCLAEKCGLCPVGSREPLG